MLCDIAPLSAQHLQTYCTPGAPVCGEVVAMVCDEPGIQLSVSAAAVGVPPSTETSRLAGLVVIVICAVAGVMFTHHPPPTAAAPLPELSMAYKDQVPLGAVPPNCEFSVAAPSAAA